MSSRAPWTVVDVLLIGLTGLILIGVWGVYMFFAPSFAAMYQELDAELPGATRFVLSSSGQIFAPIVCSILAGLGLSLRQRPARVPRRGLMMLALFLNVAVLFGTVYVLYAPIFSMAGAVE